MERSIREEARRLRQAEAGGGGGDEEEGEEGARAARAATTQAGGAAAGRVVIDLDSLAFSQGSHFMSKKQCALPPGSYRCVQGGLHAY
jgi:pre-mRNA-splicing helicase BRR2